MIIREDEAGQDQGHADHVDLARGQERGQGHTLEDHGHVQGDQGPGLVTFFS